MAPVTRPLAHAKVWSILRLQSRLSQSPNKAADPPFPPSPIALHSNIPPLQLRELECTIPGPPWDRIHKTPPALTAPLWTRSTFISLMAAHPCSELSLSFACAKSIP